MEQKKEKGGVEMQKFVEKRDVYGEECPYCGELIKGASESATKYNLSIHIDKHVRNGHSIPSKR